MDQRQNGTKKNGHYWPVQEDGISVINGDNGCFPAIVAQEAGRAIYHGRAKKIVVIGRAEDLIAITWILGRVPDMFDVQVDSTSLIVTAHCNGVASCAEETMP